MSVSRLALLPLASVLLLLPTLLHAQDAPPPPAESEGIAMELQEMIIEGKAESLLGEAPSASKGQTSMKELLARPFSRRGELLESVPGIIITQHSGDGKANQYFVRGANLDHGTDFLVYVDGMPVNFRNHAHGQGYADLNFIIPELVGELEYWKGNYYAQHGDLSSSGAARFKLVDSLPQGILTTTWGSYDYTRTLIADTIQVGSGSLTMALEHQYYNGPWDLPSDATRWNGFLRYHWEDPTDKVNLTFMGYQGDWTSTDQVPQRAIDNGTIGRYSNLDPTDGGNSRRYSLAFDWQHQDGRNTTRASAYLGYYDLDLFSNFTYFASNAAPRGDQFEQQDQRWFLGGELARDIRFDALGHEQRLTLGFQMRADWINGIGLYNTTTRDRFNEVRKDDIFQASYGLFSEFEFKPADWLRIIPGLRADVIQFDVQQSTLNENQGTLSKGMVSPKLNIVFGPWHKTEFYINGGLGFHSNDTRGVNIVTDPVTGGSADRVDPMVRTYGAEFGIRNESIPKLVNTLSLWILRSDSELVYVGDAGNTEPGPASQRYGVELASYWRPTDWAMVDLEATINDAHLRTANPSSEEIPGSVPYTLNAGISLGGKEGFFGSLRARYIGPRPLDEAATAHAKESFQVNARLGYRRANWEVAVDCLNLLNRGDNDIEYFYESQLASEAAPVADRHIHPIEPRMLRLSVTWRF